MTTVADTQGPEFDVGELSAWLNDAVPVAPSTLLGPATTQVSLDERGAPVGCTTTDRYAAWDLEEGRFTYAVGRFVPRTMEHDVAPGRP